MLADYGRENGMSGQKEQLNKLPGHLSNPEELFFSHLHIGLHTLLTPT